MKKIILLIIVIILESTVLKADTGVNTGDTSNIVRLGNIIINKQSKEIRIKCRLAIEKGILEYFLVGDKGKTYESIFKILNSKASDLKFGLILLGFKPLNFKKYMDCLYNKENDTEILQYKDTLVSIDLCKDGNLIEWENILVDKEYNFTKDYFYVFTGSFFDKNNKFVADFALNYIAIWPDKSAVLNLFSKSKNPYRGNFGFEINKKSELIKINEDFELVIKKFNLKDE